MKAIIIEDKDAKALLDGLQLAASRPAADLLGIDKELVGRMHRVFHFTVCRWLQDQGADVKG